MEPYSIVNINNKTFTEILDCGLKLCCIHTISAETNPFQVFQVSEVDSEHSNGGFTMTAGWPKLDIVRNKGLYTG